MDNNQIPMVILTDSKVSLYLILQRYPKNHEGAVNNIQRNLRILKNRNWNIKLQWVPSHCGIQGNEEADRLANIAHNLVNIDDYPSELSEIFLQVKKAAHRQWSLIWNVQRNNCSLGERKRTLEE